MHRTILFCALLSVSFTGFTATIWDGPTIEFAKKPSADGTVLENQDQLSNDVIFARGSVRGLYNAAQESSYNQVKNDSPAGTLWAFSGMGGNPSGSDFSAQNYAALNFDHWVSALGGPNNLAGNIVNRPAIVHLIDQDIYLALEFSSWGVRPSSGAGFTYSRATPSVVPIPLSLPLLLSGFAISAFLSGSRGRSR